MEVVCALRFGPSRRLGRGIGGLSSWGEREKVLERRLVPGVGVEPTIPMGREADFKSAQVCPDTSL